MAAAHFRRWDNGRAVPSKLTSSLQPEQPPAKPPQVPSQYRRTGEQQSKRDACQCCPYGYHIDLDFVQYAEGAHQQKADVDSAKLSSLNKRKRSVDGHKQNFQQQQQQQQYDEPGRKSIYDNVSPRQHEPENQQKQYTSSPYTSTPSNRLFSGSLENVVSDFEETLTQHGRSPSANRNGNNNNRINFDDHNRSPDYASDYEMTVNKNKNGRKYDGRNLGGYASDCGYAVPTAIGLNRPNTLRLASKVDEENNHYYAAPASTISSSGVGVYAAPNEARRLASTVLSDSMSSLSSASSLQNNRNGSTTTAHDSTRLGLSSAAKTTPNDVKYSVHQKNHEDFLLSPRSVSTACSSPYPKPSLGLSGRIGQQIEHLAAQLSPSPMNARGENVASSLKRLTELEAQMKSPSLLHQANNTVQEKRHLQDELNRLVHENRRYGSRSTTPTVNESTGSNGGYATALAQAMSSINAKRDATPEPPPRLDSVAKMIMTANSLSTPVSPVTVGGRMRTYSANNGGSDPTGADVFQYRRATPHFGNRSVSPSVGRTPVYGKTPTPTNDEQQHYASDSEYALGDRALERFASLRRSRHLLSRPQQNVFERQNIVEEREKPVEKLSDKDRQTSFLQTSLFAGEKMKAYEEKQKPLVRTIGVVTDVPKKQMTTNASTCTGPLPQPKPCPDCDGYRQRILALSEKPFTFNRSSQSDKCTCETCVVRSRQYFTSVGCVTTGSEFQRDAASTAQIHIPCDDCESRAALVYFNFGVNTDESLWKKKTFDASTTTESVEIRNRNTMTDMPNLHTTSCNTEPSDVRNVSTEVDKNTLFTCGGYRTITTNTTPPMKVTFGVNTEPLTEEERQQMAASIASAIQNHVHHPSTKMEIRDSQTMTDARREPMQNVPLLVTTSTNTDPKNVEPVSSPTKNEPKKLVRMMDKAVDSTVRTKDIGTRTLPPLLPALQPLMSRSSQTINEIRTMKSTMCGSDSAPSVFECDRCKIGENNTISGGQYRRIERLKSAPSFHVCTQTDAAPSSARIERSFDGVPKDEVFTKKEDPQNHQDVMWTSQTSAVFSDPDKTVETVVCPLDDEEEENVEKIEENEEKIEEIMENIEENEESENETVEDLIAEDVEEDEEDGEEIETAHSLQQRGKFDFTRPRQTRAFALSKAAATKKLLTSETKNHHRPDTMAASKKLTQSVGNFQRNTLQSKSVRLDSQKGDSLAYITEKKHHQQQTQTKTKSQGGGLSRTSMVERGSIGLKGKVSIKKHPIRKLTPAALGRADTASRFKSSFNFQRRAHETASSGNSQASASSNKDDDPSEAEDVVGPLPSEVAAAAAAAARCYVNSAVTENGETEKQGASSSVAHRKLVGDVVENLPTKVERKSDDRDGLREDETDSDDGDDSCDEGSYDTNGNITSKCDVELTDDEKREAGASSTKPEISVQVREACETINASLKGDGSGSKSSDELDRAQKLLQHEWLKTAASKRGNPAFVEHFLDVLEDYSHQLLHKVVNFCDLNENTALHYAVSHGNFDIVSLLLDTKVCNLNKANKAGYTPVMLASLCPITSDTDRMVIQRLLQMGDVNIKASQHGQTALMLAVSHGKLETTKLLLEAGAGVNIQDEDGSTALMCAAEHGHKEIVRALLLHAEIDATMTDYDGSTALTIAVDNGHKDIGVLIYAHLNYGRSATSLQVKSAPAWC